MRVEAGEWLSWVAMAANALPTAAAFILSYESAAAIFENSLPIALETLFMLVTAPRAIKAAISAYSIRS